MSAELRVLAPRDGRTVDNMLEAARQDGMIECLIIGTDADGEFVFRSSGMGNRDGLWLIEKAREWVMKGE